MSRSRDIRMREEQGVEEDIPYVAILCLGRMCVRSVHAVDQLVELTFVVGYVEGHG
jgi:hypothetical protein